MISLLLEGVSVRTGGRTILDDVTLGFAAGQVTAIIGPNGAGKSTLLRVAAGQLRAAAGTTSLGGRLLGDIPPKHAARRRAVMPQDTTVAFPFTVEEVVTMGRAPWDTPGAGDRQVVADVLALTELCEFAHREITSLSGGERQRVALARVIAQATPVREGSVILLDEPTAAMDVAHAETTLRLARALAADGAAVGVVLHDIDAAASYADHVVLMDAGRIHAAGTVREVCTAQLLTHVYRTPIDVHDHAGRLHVGPGRHFLGDRGRWGAVANCTG